MTYSSHEHPASSNERLIRCVICVLATCLGVATSTRADVIACDQRRASVNVQLTALIDGELQFQLPSGRTQSCLISNVDYLQITGWGLFNVAEKQLRNKDYRRAAIAYEQALRKLKQQHAADAQPGSNSNTDQSSAHTLDRKLLIRCRLARAYDLQGRFDRAVEVYLEAITQMPALRTMLQPENYPAAVSSFWEKADAAVQQVIDDRHDEALGRFLEQWRSTWPTRRSAQPTTKPADVEDAQLDAAVVENAAQLKAIGSAISAGNVEHAQEMLEQIWQRVSNALKPEAYYLLGRILTAQAERASGEQARRLRHRAGLALMRVVIHFPGHAHAPECLYRAGALCAKLDMNTQAMELWQELVNQYPNAQRWVGVAQQAMAGQQVSE